MVNATHQIGGATGRLILPDVQTAVALAISKKLQPERKLDTGLYTVRGVATVMVDCHVKKAEPSSAKGTLKEEELLTLALTVGAGLSGVKLVTAMEKVLAAIETEKEARRKPKEGATNVVGECEIISFVAE